MSHLHLLVQADRICAGIGGPVRFDVGDPERGGEQLVIDFAAREVRAYSGEKCRYWLAADRDLAERLIVDREHDWVNSLKADLSRFGRIEDDVLTCQLHGWRFDLQRGACLTAAGYPLRAERIGQ